MSDVVTGSGSELYISDDIPATYDKTGFTNVGVVWVKVSNVTNIGEYGKQFNTVDFSPLDTDEIFEYKTTFKNGNVAVSIGANPADAGQILMLNASGVKTQYSFKIKRSNGDIDAFVGQVADFKKGSLDSGSLDVISSSLLAQKPIINIK